MAQMRGREGQLTNHSSRIHSKLDRTICISDLRPRTSASNQASNIHIQHKPETKACVSPDKTVCSNKRKESVPGLWPSGNCPEFLQALYQFAPGETRLSRGGE